MKYKINLQHKQDKEIYPLGEHFRGISAAGEELDFTNYYMQKNGKPFYGISGEYHFSRSDENCWNDELQKMKRCGINIVATYVFWNHHEQKEGEFCWEGRFNLRRFIHLCQKNGMYVILRMGPFAHGEVRNGGFPDWLYGKPFEPRALNNGFMWYVRRLYSEIGKQITGLLYKDGGPIIAAQMDNEYQHASAQWENTVGISNEWIPSGHDGEAYLYRLREIARESGIDVPFYTCTGWGGAPTPEQMLPLWGGYAYRPWLFYSYKGEHPATEEYHYYDYHNNTIPFCGDFVPAYKPQSRPYACCEMGGGMTNCYYYRFILPYKSVDAMANIKIASGCNFVGYYMFKGGTNPKGNGPEFLNESQMPKLSYDYQAAIGEFGQVRESYKRLKAIHYFLESFGEDLCQMGTFLPDGAMEIGPDDLDTLRFAVRKQDNHGYLFINNFQDHRTMSEKKNCEICLQLDDETIAVENIGLASDENCILPFHMDMDGILLKYATAQPVTSWNGDDETCYLFMIPSGMQGNFVFEEEAKVLVQEHTYGRMMRVKKAGHAIRIYTVSREVMNQLYVVNYKMTKFLVITDGVPLLDENGLRIESQNLVSHIAILHGPLLRENEATIRVQIEDKEWSHYELHTKEKKIPVELMQVGTTRYTLQFPENLMEGIKEALLQIKYEGDIGSAFIDGDMIHDNFGNGDTWEIGLRAHEKRLQKSPLTIYITPLKKGVTVHVESAMAARNEEIEEEVGSLLEVKVQPIYQLYAEFVE